MVSKDPRTVALPYRAIKLRNGKVRWRWTRGLKGVSFNVRLQKERRVKGGAGNLLHPVS
jgi:hypothetical protein